ncbi:RNA polymerase sigma factor [Paremcibacter congregatus]|uniref:RNA polymerase sigma factor n=1 Tax=Paremcibacter congregatus TaxID=2043170 RepID=UPI003A90F5F6
MDQSQSEIIRDWYERYGHDLYRSMCAATKNKDDASEISQEAFLKVAMKVMKEEGSTTIENPKAFLYRVAYNELYKRYHKTKHEVHLKGILINTAFELSDEITPEREVATREELQAIQKAIKALPRKQQKVFLLSREEHLPQKEIGRRLGIETVTVKRHIIRALAVLKGVRKDFNDGS